MLNGHDGTWVAHPGLVSLATEVFDAYMKAPNQINKLREDVHITEEALVQQPFGTITEEGIRENINVGILYIESWLMGQGAAALYNLMEDAATAEISRTQVWLWLQNNELLEDGRTFTEGMYEQFKKEELKKIKSYVGKDRYGNGKFELAVQLFDELILNKEFVEFLTLPAYKYL